MWLDSPSPIITKAQSGLRVVRPSVACALLLRPPIFSSARYLQLLKPAATAMGLDYCRLLHRQVRHAWGVDAIVLLLCFYDDIQTTALTTPRRRDPGRADPAKAPNEPARPARHVAKHAATHHSDLSERRACALFRLPSSRCKLLPSNSFPQIPSALWRFCGAARRHEPLCLTCSTPCVPWPALHADMFAPRLLGSLVDARRRRADMRSPDAVRASFNRPGSRLSFLL